MTKDRYLKLKGWFSSHETALRILELLYKFLPIVMIIVFPVILVLNALDGIDRELIRMIIVPLAVLIEVTVLRKIIKKPRPYEKYSTEPIIDREGKGESFPSRHTASAFIIAMCCIPISLSLTIILSIVAIIIALTRIFAGVHYISDVIIGALISIITGIIFFVIL